MRAAHSQKGAAAVEFALLLPILLLVFFGLVELSLALYNKAVLTNASREGARAGIVLRSPPMSDAQISDVVLAYTRDTLLSMGTAHTPAVTVLRSSTPEFPSTLNVTVRYTYSGLGLGRLLSAMDQPMVLSSSTVMVTE
jgi:Flp pilus assembly protein TadG